MYYITFWKQPSQHSTYYCTALAASRSGSESQQHKQPVLFTTAQQFTDLGWSEFPSRPSSSPGRTRVVLRAQRLFSLTSQELRSQPLACSPCKTSCGVRSNNADCSRRGWISAESEWSNLIGWRALLLLLCSTHMTISHALPRVDKGHSFCPSSVRNYAKP